MCNYGKKYQEKEENLDKPHEEDEPYEEEELIDVMPTSEDIDMAIEAALSSVSDDEGKDDDDEDSLFSDDSMEAEDPLSPDVQNDFRGFEDSLTPMDQSWIEDLVAEHINSLFP